MNRSQILIVACVVVLSALPVAAETEMEQAPITWKQAALEEGGALYAELCAVCHGVDGKGDGPAAPALKSALSDLTMLAADNDGEFPAARVEKVITGSLTLPAHGSAEMPVWGKVFEDVRVERKPGERWAFSRAKIYNLTEYLKTIQAE